MLRHPKVSVVLPVWNGERFLARALNSVLLQTFDSFELLLIDDGSTDGTHAIARAFEERDERVVVLALDHGGIARALNAGVAAAQGQYIARMDSDDVAFPTRLHKQVAYLDLHSECVAVGSSIEIIDENGRKIGFRSFAQTHAAIVSDLIRGSSQLAHPTALVRRDALLAVGGYAADRYPSEDFDLWLRLSERGDLANIAEPLLQYRRHKAAVGVRERANQLTMSASIIDEARERRGLLPLKRRMLRIGKSHAGRYHFECARIALQHGPRIAAIRHAGASIASEPFWSDAYATLLACVLPKRMLRLIVSLRSRRRSDDGEDWP